MSNQSYWIHHLRQQDTLRGGSKWERPAKGGQEVGGRLAGLRPPRSNMTAPTPRGCRRSPEIRRGEASPDVPLSVQAG